VFEELKVRRLAVFKNTFYFVIKYNASKPNLITSFSLINKISKQKHEQSVIVSIHVLNKS